MKHKILISSLDEDNSILPLIRTTLHQENNND